MKKFIAAGIQIAPILNDISGTIEKCIAWLERAVNETKADLVVFPETITTGFSPGISVEELYEKVDGVPGKLTEAVQEAAGRMRVHVVWPTYTRGAEEGEVFNSSVLIDDHGEILGVYHKTHPFPTERVGGGRLDDPRHGYPGV